jgi:HK97 family phage prohead protease
MTDTPPPIEFRSAATVAVHHPERVIEVLAVPYDVETLVEHRGRTVRETIAAHAFAGAVTSNRKRLAHRDHDPVTGDKGPIVGIVRRLTDRADGLRAAMKISRGPLGDETLDWAEDGILDASIGFRPNAGGEHWSADRQSRRITNGFLDHIALVPYPAYEGAKVLAVRAAAPPPPPRSTPNLDRIHLAALAAHYGYALTQSP